MSSGLGDDDKKFIRDSLLEIMDALVELRSKDTEPEKQDLRNRQLTKIWNILTKLGIVYEDKKD